MSCNILNWWLFEKWWRFHFKNPDLSSEVSPRHIWIILQLPISKTWHLDSFNFQRLIYKIQEAFHLQLSAEAQCWNAGIGIQRTAFSFPRGNKNNTERLPVFACYNTALLKARFLLRSFNFHSFSWQVSECWLDYITVLKVKIKKFKLNCFLNLISVPCIISLGVLLQQSVNFLWVIPQNSANG